MSARSHTTHMPMDSDTSAIHQSTKQTAPAGVNEVTSQHEESHHIEDNHQGPTLWETVLNSPLRHLASHSTLNSLESHSTATSHLHQSRDSRDTSRTSRQGHRKAFYPLPTNFEEQRHEGNPRVRIAQHAKLYEPDTTLNGEETINTKSQPKSTGTRNPAGKGGSHGSSVKSDESTLIDRKRSSSLKKAGPANEDEKLRSLRKGSSTPTPTDEEKAAKDEEDGENNYPGPMGLAILSIGLMLCVFLISLNRTVITPAIPYIVNEFQSYADIGWYGSAYLLTAGSFQPLYGRVFMLFDIKWSYLCSLAIFELGSLLCGVAPNSSALIAGRAIQGLGSAGILTGSFVICSHAVPLAKRPVLTAVVGLMFGVGSTVGPIVGGVFTDYSTWRWCFYLNIIGGGVTFFALVCFFKSNSKHALMDKSFWYRLFELDLVGNVLILGASTQLFLALQYAEQHLPWDSSIVLGLLIGALCTFVMFCTWLWWKADGALIPPRIIAQRSVACSCAVAFFLYSATLIHMFYLPFWFQAIQGASATRSGVNLIPYVVANAVFTLLAGIFVSKNGFFTIPAIVGCAIGTIGCGLLSMVDLDTGTKWIGYEICISAGVGMAIQQGFTAVQIVLPLNEVAIGTAAVVAFQSLGGAIFVSVGNTILQSNLLSADQDGRLPRVDVQAVIDAGAAGFRDIVPIEELPALLTVYNEALRQVFIAAIPLCGLAMVSACFLEWRDLKDQSRAKEEKDRKAAECRNELEQAILKSHRKSLNSANSAGWANRS